MIRKKEIRLAATPVIARTMPMAAPHMVDATRGTLGIIVFRLLPAMNAQKQVEGTEAAANRRNIADPIGPPMPLMTSSYFQPRFGLSAWAPATAINGSPAAISV